MGEWSMTGWWGRHLRARAALVAAGALGAFAFAASNASAAMFPQCPPVGNNQGCSQLIVINHSGSVVVQVDPAAPPNGYDGVEDTLVGLQNNSSHSVRSVNLASPSASIFGFDQDGLCDPPDWPSAPAVTPPNCPGTQGFGPTGYEGPNNAFTNVSSNFLTGTVNFTSPVPPGGSAYWGLEEALQPGQLLSGAGGAPITSAPTVSGQNVSFSIICVGQNSCSGVAQLVVFEHRKGNAWIARSHKRIKQVVVGSVSVSIPAGGTSPVKVSLNKAGRKLLSKKYSLPVQVRVKLGGVVTQVGKVKFKGHKRSRHH